MKRDEKNIHLPTVNQAFGNPQPIFINQPILNIALEFHVLDCQKKTIIQI